MGYYKNIDASQQEDVDRIVRWWKENNNQIPEYVMKRVLADEKLLGDLLDAWEARTYAPKPASSHVSLQQPAKKQKADWSMGSKETKMFVWVYITTMALVLAGVVALAVTA